MSDTTAILLAIRDLRSEQAARLESVQRQLDLMTRRLGGVPEQLATREAARYAQVSADTLYRWRDQGRLPYHDGPRPWSRVELDAVLTGVPVTVPRGRRARRPA